MIWVIAVLSVLLAVMIWLLFTPIIICIDTHANAYYFKMKGVCKISLNTGKTPIVMDIETPIRKISFTPFEKKKSGKKTRRKTTKRKSSQAIFKFIVGLIKSFELIKMNLNLDTDDYIRNAQLIPVFLFLNGKNRTFSINFDGNTNFQMTLKNRLIKMLKPAIIVTTSK